jgi:thiol-disulfide isomerase/thioredoxin/outer membrane lipoprotein-sorting protein
MLKRAACAIIVFLLTSFAFCAEPDAAQLLRNAAKQYRESQNYRLEWETKITETTPFSNGWSKQSYVVAVSDKKVRFERKGSGPNWVRISDGETDWFLDPGLRQYSIQPADPSKPIGPAVAGTAAGTAQGWVKSSVQSLQRLDGEAASADIEKDETLKIGPSAFSCAVVHSLQATSYREGVESSRESRYWIDKATGLVRKSVTVTRGPRSFSDDVNDQTRTIETLYTTVDFGKPPDPSLFVFTPPMDAYLIDDARQTIARPLTLGSIPPPLQLTRKDGQMLNLADLRGKVVLVQFWASWCGGCLEEMKALAELPKSYLDKGLVILAVDEDEVPQRGDDYLGSKNYVWLNLHDKGAVTRAVWGINGYPGVVLLDRDGKAVWIGVGFDKNSNATLRAQLDDPKLGLAP